MKEFAGKWRIKVKAKDGKVLSVSYKGETNPPAESDVLIFYNITTFDYRNIWPSAQVVIQSQATGKYLCLKEPLELGWYGRTICFAAFEPAGEFDTASQFILWPSRIRTGSGSLSRLGGDYGSYELGVQRKLDSIQLGLSAVSHPWIGASGKDPCEGDSSERYVGWDLQFECVTPTLHWMLTGDDSNLDLRRVDLSGQDLSNVNLTNADLRGADLSGATVQGTTLSAATMSGSNLSKVDLTAAKFHTPPVMQGLEGNPTCLKGAKVPLGMIGKDWSDLDLDGATIVGIKLGQDLQKLKAPRANLSNVDLSGLLLDEADFSHATIINTSFTGSTLTKAHFDHAELYNTRFISCNLEGASFQAAQMGGVEGQAAADFSYAYLANVDLTGDVNLYAATMVGVTMFGGQTRIGNKAILDLVNLADAYLVEVSFKDLNLRGASLDNSCLIDADFTGSDLSTFKEKEEKEKQSTLTGAKRSTLTGACLQGANFTNAILDDATFAKAAISFDKGQLLVQYRDENGKITQEMPHKYKKTSGLELVSLPDSLTCPNGKTVAENKARKVSLGDMLTAGDAPTKWIAPDR